MWYFPYSFESWCNSSDIERSHPRWNMPTCSIIKITMNCPWLPFDVQNAINLSRPPVTQVTKMPKSAYNGPSGDVSRHSISNK